jgi:HNH endonuclease
MRMQLIDHQTRLQLPGSWPRALAPPALNRMDHPTPFLVCDLETARERYANLTAALPGVRCFYAVKCNSEPELLAAFDQLGSIHGPNDGPGDHHHDQPNGHPHHNGPRTAASPTDPGGHQPHGADGVARSGQGHLAGRLRAAAALLPPALGGAPTQPLEVGRTSRVVQPAQRTALAVRDGGCVFPACQRPLAWCDAHHLQHWLHGGPTDLANLALLCRTRHRAVHEGGWRLARGPDGRLIATPPHRTNRPHRRRHPTAA